jgi:Fic family protein
VRTNHDLTHWIKFFLEAVIETANSGVKTFQDILALKQEMDTFIVGFGKKAHNASKLIEYLYQKPIIGIGEIVKPLGISKQTASVLVKEFEEKGILQEITGYERNKLFIFDKYLKIYSQS